ncbi:hypothetical protein BT93_L2813 [Corymbia citriodora subsp. variegata]|uniref:F-box domain-containing protein n=1 Tax=Corymbia citriodora subsp. variegata TaxID=360336 RepID=A0A8T0CIR9_CORYI|nr:hypothetical protein BT93_L2813 [Corymbia citriodora subsp. variegata]
MDYSIGSYLPKNLHNPNDEFNNQSCKDSRILKHGNFRINVRVLAMLRNGEILLEYHNRVLVRYDPNHDKTVTLMLEGLPKWFQSIVHSHGAIISTLPHEIVVDILSRLPTPSLFRAQFVCWLWRALVRDPLLLQLHQPHAASSHDLSLVFHSNPPLRSQLYLVEDVSGCRGDGRNRSASEFHPPFAMVVPDFNLVRSSEGLLCLANVLSSHDVYMYNPLIGEYREFPDLEGHQSILRIVFGFGFDETEKDYKVIKIVYPIERPQFKDRLAYSEVQVCSLRSPTWRRLGNSTHSLEATPSQPLVNNRLHWTTLKSKYWSVRIVSFDLSDEQFRDVPTPECMYFLAGWCHLVELGGCLSTTLMSKSGALEIWVMKEYGMQESWIRDYSIGSYLPRNLHNPNDEFNNRSCKDSRILKCGNFQINVRVLEMLRNGQILLDQGLQHWILPAQESP